MDLMITVLAVFSVASLATLGIVALPWSDAEVDASALAFAALPEVVPVVAPSTGATQAA